MLRVRTKLQAFRHGSCHYRRGQTVPRLGSTPGTASPIRRSGKRSHRMDEESRAVQFFRLLFFPLLRTDEFFDLPVTEYVRKGTSGCGCGCLVRPLALLAFAGFLSAV